MVLLVQCVLSMAIGIATCLAQIALGQIAVAAQESMSESSPNAERFANG